MGLVYLTLVVECPKTEEEAVKNFTEYPALYRGNDKYPIRIIQRASLIGNFNPFQMPAFFCPVCGSNKFTDLAPYGGVWCDNCNANFEVAATCDGNRKLSVHCFTKNVWSNKTKPLGMKYEAHYWTVIWQHDGRVVWLTRTSDKTIRSVSLENDKIVIES